MTPISNHDDDATLIVDSLSNPAAFAQIFDRHAVALLGYVTRRVGSDHADDLVGEMFRIAFESRHRYDRTRLDARPWLYGIAANLVLKHQRSTKRGNSALQRIAQVETSVQVPFDEALVETAETSHRARQLMRLLDQLAPQDRETVLLYVWENLTYEQVGEALEIPVGTVRSRLHRVRRQIRELSQPDENELNEDSFCLDEGTNR